MKKRILAFLLAVVTVFACAACGEKQKGPSGPADPDTPPQEQEAPVYVEGTLHKVKVTESTRPFIVNGATDYKIVFSGGNLTGQAAKFISTQLYNATHVELEVEERSASASAAWDATQKLIVLNDTALFKTAGLTMPTDDIGLNGYYIRTLGNSVFLMTKDEMGCQYAALSFLKHVVGYDMIASDMTVFEKDGTTLPEMEIVEKPDYDFITAAWSAMREQKATYGMGFMSNGLDLFMNSVHNIFNILSPDDWGAHGAIEQHPDWFSDDGQQWCYTAHGDEKELERMREECIKVLKQTILDNPDKRLLTVTQRDFNVECTCDACAALKNKYHSAAGSIIRFLNPVVDAIQEWLEDLTAPGEEKRDVSIMFFAYHRSETPPADKVDGEWVAIDDSVICRDKLWVFLAPIRAIYTVPFTDEKNDIYRERAEAWSACTDHLFMWLYQADFRYYLYPYATWDTALPDYRYFKSIGASGMFNQDQVDQGMSDTAFSELKYYLASKGLFDVNVDYKTLVDRFFSLHFREAAAPMKEMFDSVRARSMYLETAYPGKVLGDIYNQIEEKEYWPKRLLDGYTELIDEALAAIEPYATTDPDLYAILRRHVLMESVFPRYALIRLHSAEYSAETLRQMQISLRDDCRELGVRQYAEQNSSGTHYLEELFAEWGVA